VNKLNILRGLSKRKRKEDTTKLPLTDQDGEDISRVDGVEHDFFITLSEPTLEDIEQFQLAAIARIANEKDEIRLETRPVEAVLCLAENKVLVDGRLPVIEDDDSIGFIRLAGSPTAIADIINNQLSYTMALCIMSMAMKHLGLTDDDNEVKIVIDEASS